jgi:hypothetical protein
MRMKKQFMIIIIVFILCSGFCGCFGFGENQQKKPPSLIDSDGDGLSDEQENLIGTNSSNPDSDNDGVHDFFETENSTPIDSDDDGVIDALDVDDDGDVVPTASEHPDDTRDGNPSDAVDTDNDGIPNYLDNDDDNDGIPTSIEVSYSKINGDDVDNDSLANYLDADSDADGRNDSVERTGDTDGDGIPNFLDSNDNDGPFGDLDYDGVSNQDEGAMDPNPSDSDDDGIPDYVDPDNPGGGSPTEQGKFIGVWNNIEVVDEQWIFYENNTRKTVSNEYDDEMQQSYVLTIWSIYEIVNNKICFRDLDAPSEQPSVCFDYTFSENNTILTVSFGGVVAFSLEKDSL